MGYLAELSIRSIAGHLALARAALEQYKLHRVLFVPANIPPHKQKQPLSPFLHRFAMLVLATAEEKAFVPSLLEAPEEVRLWGGRLRSGQITRSTRCDC